MTLDFTDFMEHISVLRDDVVRAFEPINGGKIVDCTLGVGGHTFALLERFPTCAVLGIDADRSAIAHVERERSVRGIAPARLMLAHGNFRDCDRLVRAAGWESINGILFDFGFSSRTMSDPARGLSFQEEGPLDMRFDQSADGVTAATIVNTWTEEELASAFAEYGGEHAAHRIAHAITLQRRMHPLTTTTALAECIARVAPRWSRIHPATKVFQALRIMVNDELGAIREALPKALDLLAPQGRIVTIAFHSLEDRIVKQFFKEEHAKDHLRIETKHVIRPPRSEVIANPRSRSARLRIATKN